MAAAEGSKEMNQINKQMFDALSVIALDKKIKAWLEANDPNALAQVSAARKSYRNDSKMKNRKVIEYAISQINKHDLRLGTIKPIWADQFQLEMRECFGGKVKLYRVDNQLFVRGEAKWKRYAMGAFDMFRAKMG